MPLMLGDDKNIISENIRTLRGEGKPEAQSLAIALSKAGKTKRKSPHSAANLGAFHHPKSVK